MTVNKEKTFNVNIISERLLVTPAELKSKVPLSDPAAETVLRHRDILQEILQRRDHRIFIVCGPCSVHDLKAAFEYAQRLRELADRVGDTLVLVMRVYFEKPRTAVGWKGFINDPDLDDSFKIEEGLYRARELMLRINSLGLPVATEALDPVVPQYLDDLVTWTAIGARTTESQTHREMASGLSTPVGFKNGTDGGIQVAINALKSAASSHRFLGINRAGQVAVMETRGNAFGHVVLRGGIKPNYDSVSIALCERALKEASLPVNVVVDCSHGNSMKDPTLQPLVLENCVHQILEGNRSIVGLMLESNLSFGSQPLTREIASLAYGVSITDGCIDWSETERILQEAASKLHPILLQRFS